MCLCVHTYAYNETTLWRAPWEEKAELANKNVKARTIQMTIQIQKEIQIITAARYQFTFPGLVKTKVSEDEGRHRGSEGRLIPVGAGQVHLVT